MIKNKLTLCFLFLLGVMISSLAQNGRSEVKTQLDFKIDSMRVAFDFPAVAYGVIRNDSIIALNVLGYRNIETKEKTQQTDYFHIGSNTKSFTAFLAGSLVDKGLINWDTKFFDLYPELKENSKPEYFDITLEKLLSHRARFIAFQEEPEVSNLIRECEDISNGETMISKKRYYLIKQVLQKEPRPIYEQYDNCYSNAGFIAAGLMLEKASGLTYEELMTKLSGETSLDLIIGVPVDYSSEQPIGHINPQYWAIDIKKDLVPISNQLRMFHNYNQFMLLCTPSGNLSIRTEKFLDFLNMHIQGLQDRDNYLKSETYRHILTTFPKYSNGWWVDKIEGNFEYAHRGSNGTFYSFAGIFPERKLGIVVMINTYNESGLTDIIKVINDWYK